MVPKRIWYDGHTQHSREVRHNPPEPYSIHPQYEYVLFDHLDKLERLIEEMASLIRVADFEDLGDYHASVEILKEVENL